MHQAHQLKVPYDKDITMGHLKGCLDYFIKEFFKNVKTDLDLVFSFTELSVKLILDIELKMEK